MTADCSTSGTLTVQLPSRDSRKILALSKIEAVTMILDPPHPSPRDELGEAIRSLASGRRFGALDPAVRPGPEPFYAEDRIAGCPTRLRFLPATAIHATNCPVIRENVELADENARDVPVERPIRIEVPISGIGIESPRHGLLRKFTSSIDRPGDTPYVCPMKDSEDSAKLTRMLATGNTERWSRRTGTIFLVIHDVWNTYHGFRQAQRREN